MVEVRYTSEGVLLSCDDHHKKDKERDWSTEHVLSSFSGQIIRVAKHETEKGNGNDIVRLEKKHGKVTTITFCQDLECPTACGNRLIWKSKGDEKRLFVIDLEELQEHQKSEKDDELGFFNYSKVKKTIDLEEHMRDESITSLLPCTPSYILHQVTDKSDIGIEELKTCYDYLKVVLK